MSGRLPKTVRSADFSPQPIERTEVRTTEPYLLRSIDWT